VDVSDFYRIKRPVANREVPKKKCYTFRDRPLLQWNLSKYNGTLYSKQFSSVNRTPEKQKWHVL